MYLTPDEFETRFGFAKPDPTESEGEPAQMVFYCKAGVRAKTAAQMAVQAGYDPANIGVYSGSWLDWERRGGKVEKWEGNDF
jgi:rhodanese-related sulfurtransferase